MTRPDVLILTALQDELEAVLALGEGGRQGWEEARDRRGFRYHRRAFPGAHGQPLLVAAAWAGDMGETEAAGRGQQLIDELDPACLAMCGICAGRRGEAALGDVIVADRVYSYDHGKLIAGEGGEELWHDLRTYNLEASWKHDAAFFAGEFNAAAGEMQAKRPIAKAAQRRWVLYALDAAGRGEEPAPIEHPERRERCPRWSEVVRVLEVEGLLRVDEEQGELALTDEGRRWVRRDRLLHPDGVMEAPFKVHLGAIATGKTVREDPELFDRLRRLVRKTLGVEMEAAAIGAVAERLGRRSIIVKAVSDHGDHEKDDSFREFACRASAEVLLGFLRRQVVPRPQPIDNREDARDDDESVTAPWFTSDRTHSELSARVERVCRVREGDAATVVELEPRQPLCGLLEVWRPKEGSPWRFPIGVVDRPLDYMAIMVFGEILEAYRAENPYAPGRLIHLGDPAPSALLEPARVRGIELIPFSEYQRLLDLTRYTERQLARVDADDRYPAALYVEQRAKHRLGRAPWEPAEDVLQEILSVLDSEHGRLLLVLGDFGTGKTFLMRELCRRLTASGDRKPVLVEMRALEKRRTLNELLAQHFAAAGMGKIDLEGFRYLLAEGRVVLLFDGFDELAFRVTYERVLEHFATVLEAASERAKVVVTSRTGHFLTDQEVNKELANRAEQTGHARLFKLESFEPDQIRRFLVKLLGDEAAAAARFKLLSDVEDLLGLSANPRMLSFIAEIEEEELKATRERAGRITSAALYELLLRRWLCGEVKLAMDTAEDPALGEAQLWKAVTDLALMLWPKTERGVGIEEIPRELIAAAEALDPKRKPAEEGQVRHQLGSRSLLVRDEGGSFSFLHQSVLEWLVADAAARAVKEAGDAPVLGQREMSDLMVDFFIARVGREAAARWAGGKRGAGAEEIARKNAQRVERRLRSGMESGGEIEVREEEVELEAAWDFEGEDLRGRDFSRQDLRGASFARANLEGAALVQADLRGATLVGAKLRRANLRGALLEGADLSDADLSWANLLKADLTGTRVLGARFFGAKLLGAKLPMLEEEQRWGAASDVGKLEPAWTICSAVYTVAFNPKEELLAAGDNAGTTTVWDAVTGMSLLVLRGHIGGIRSVAWSADGRTLASGSFDNTVRLWQVCTGKALAVLQGHTDRVQSVAWSADSQTLASGSLDNTVRLWHAHTGKALAVLHGHAFGVQSVTWSADGQTLASGSLDSTVRLWQANEGKALAVVQGHADKVQSVAWSADGQTLAWGSSDNTVRLWQVRTGKLMVVLRGHTNKVQSVAWSADGQTLVSGSYDSTVRLWQARTGKALAVLQGHAESVQSVAWSADGQTLVSGSYDSTVRLWQARTGKAFAVLQGQAESVQSVAWSTDGQILASISYDSTVRLWQARTGKALAVLQGHAESVQNVAWNADGQILASGSDDYGTMRLWQLHTGKSLVVLQGHARRVQSIAWSADRQTLASGSDDTTVRLWQARTGEALAVLHGHAWGVRSVAWSADGQTLASGSDDNTVRLWEARTGKVLAVLQGHTESVQSVAWSADGQTLASGSNDNTVRLWQARTGKVLAVLQGHAAGVRSVAWSADGQTLASGSDDNTVRLWQVRTGKELAVLHGHASAVHSVCFHPAGHTLASASSDGTIRLWDVATQRCLAILLPLPEGWVAFTPDGRYKFGGNLAGGFWHVIGLCRFEPGELDPYVPGLRLADDEPLVPAIPPAPPITG